MKEYQFRAPRPDMRTAHRFYQEGSYSLGTELSLRGKEREDHFRAILDDLKSVTKLHFPRTGNLEYAILKAHLIVEHTITQYIRCMSHVAVEPKAVRFSFSQKLEIAYLLGFGIHDPVTLPTVERLNKIRNQVAHTFFIDRALVDEMLRINSDDYDQFAAANDRQRIRHLKAICLHINGLVSGILMASYSFSTLRDEAPEGAMEMAVKEYPFPLDPEEVSYCVFPACMEDDPHIFFHGTNKVFLQSILTNGFSIQENLPSVSFSKQSSLALGYACKRRSEAAPGGCIIAVRYSDLSASNLEREVSTLLDRTCDPQPEIVGYCLVPASYDHR